MEPLISVIVPVYNVEAYVDKCVQSIVGQTYKRLEILLVDDGSTDQSGALCDEWAEKDKRIRVIHKKNGGQADARNTGIAQATGEYIGFVDSDDWIDRQMYELLLQLLRQHEAQAAECRMFFYSDQTISDIPRGEETVTVFDRQGAVESLLKETHFQCAVPNMLITSRIAKSVLFDIGKIHEDILWPYRVLRQTSRAVHTSRRLYAYYQRQGSTMNSVYSEKRFDALDALQQRAEEVKTDFPALYAAAERSYLGACMYHYQTLCRLPESQEYELFKKRLHTRFCEGDCRTAFAGISWKHRLWYALFVRMPLLTCTLRNALKIGL